MKSYRLPNLNAIKVFGVAAKCKSFAEAADILCISASAVTRHIHTLEYQLGFKLFHRTTRQHGLTKAGERYKMDVERTLRILEQASKRERFLEHQNEVLRIQTTDSFASCWLLEKLDDFTQKHPEITVYITTNLYHEELDVKQADIAIIFGNGSWNEVQSELILAEQIFPVCSHLLKSGDRQDIEVLHNHILIHDYNIGLSWDDWFDYAKDEVILDSHKIPDTSHGLYVNHSHLALKAAKHGQGITLASSVLVASSLQKGELVRLFSSQITTGYGYYLVTQHHNTHHQAKDSFVEWIKDQAFSLRC